MVQRLTFEFYVDIFVFFTISEIKLCQKSIFKISSFMMYTQLFFVLFCISSVILIIIF